MLLRPFLNDTTSCASYLFGCGTHAKLAVVDPHADLVDDYLSAASALGFPIVAVVQTPVPADPLSRLAAPLQRRGANPHPPARAGGRVEHVAGGRGASGNPVSWIGFERAHNPLLALADPGAFADALVAEMPPRPAEQERIVAANRSGKAGAPA